MYLILSDADDNATPKVFHNGVDVIRLKAVGEEKGCRKRSDEEGPMEKIRLRRWLISELTMALIPCEMREKKKVFIYLMSE